jgi:hypothetical protein
VAGISCIRPIAPAREIASVLNALSAWITAFTMAGGTPASVAAWRMSRSKRRPSLRETADHANPLGGRTRL